MAGNSDGSIIIDTKLDTKGFGDGSKELLQAIHSLSQEINRLGETIQSTFSGYASSLRDTSTGTSEMGQSVTETDTKVKNLSGSVLELKTNLNNMENQSFDLGIDAQKQGVDSLGRDISNLEQNIGNMSQVAESAIGGDSQALMQFESQAEQAQTEIENLSARLEEFGQSDIPSDEYNQISASIEKAQSDLAQLNQQQNALRESGAREDSEEWVQLQTQIENANDRLLDYIAKRAVFKANNNDNTGTLGANTEEYAEYEERIQNLDAELREMQGNVSRAFDSGSAKEASTEVEQLSTATQEVAQSARQAEEGLKEVETTASNLSNETPNFDLSQSEQSVVNMEKGLQNLNQTMDSMSSHAEGAMNGDTNAMAKFEQESAKAQGTLDGLKQQLDAIGNSNFQTDDYKAVTSDIQKTSEELDKLIAKQDKMEAIGTNKKSMSWKGLQYDIDLTRRKLNDLIATREAYESEGQGGFSGANTEQYTQYANAITEIESKLAGMHNEVNKAFEAPDTSSWNRMTTLSGMIRNSFTSTFGQIRTSASNIGATVSNTINHPLQTVDRILGTVASSAMRAATNLARMTGGAIVSGIKKIGSAAKSAAANILSMAKNAASNGFKKLSSSLLSIGKHSNTANNRLSGSLKTMLRYGLGIRSLFVLVNKLRSALIEGFKNIAKADPGFNEKISAFMTALNRLKASFAAAFAPLAEVVMPILTSLMNVISDLLNKFGQLMAALTGKSTYTKATAIQQDYAKSLDKSSNSTKKNTKATKENQKTIAGFDDVEILKANKEDEKAESNPFSTSPIGSSMNDLADKLKDMWKKADFSELGRMLGEKLKDALEKIPWAKIKATLRKIAKSIATFLNGFLETPGLFTVIGKTIAQAINSAFEFVESFVSNFHWASLGRAIRDLILGVLNNLDWKLIYKTFEELGRGLGTTLQNIFGNQEIWTGIFTSISKALNSVVNGLVAFIEAVNWKEIAGYIGKGLNDGIEAFDWKKLSTLLCDLTNGIFDIWYTFITTFDFGKFGANIGKGVSHSLRTINWKEGAASVAETINSLFEALNGFITNTDWGALGKAIVDTIAGFFGNLDWGGFAETISNFIKGLCDTLSSAIQAVDWATLPSKITSAIMDFFTNFDWSGVAKSIGKLYGSIFKAIIDLSKSLYEDMKKVGKHIIEGGLEGIIDALKNIGSWIKKNIFDPFIDGFKEAFGIASPAKEMIPLGGYIIEGMLKGILNGLSSIGSWLNTNVFTPITSKFKSLFGMVSGASSVFMKYGKTFISSLKKGINEKKKDVLDATKNIVSGIKEKFTGQKWGTLGGNIGTGIYNGLVKSSKNLLNLAWNTATNMYNKACEALGIHSPSRKFFWIAEMMVAGLSKGIEYSKGVALNTVSKLATAVTKEAEDKSPMMRIDTQASGLESVLDNFSDRIVDGFSTLIEQLENIANGASFTIPSVAKGMVTPYSVRKSTLSNDSTELSELIELLGDSEYDRITRDELREILTDMFTRFMNIRFYMGDEEVARHANAGNERLHRRYGIG